MTSAARRIADLLDQNRLDAALDDVKTALKSAGTDRDLRYLYIDLLVLDGDFERADGQCDIASRMQPEDALGFALLRQQIRAMAARKAWFDTGAVPEFPGGPTELDQLAVKLNLAIRDNAGDEAASLLARLEESRGLRPMLWNGAAIDDLRDLDDRIPHALEVLTNGGAYLWVDFARIDSVAVQPMRRPRDIAYREAELTLTSGTTASVLLPALYPGAPETPALALGRETDWVDALPGIVTGRGQRCLLAGEALASFHDLTSLEAVTTDGERQAAHG